LIKATTRASIEHLCLPGEVLGSPSQRSNTFAPSWERIAASKSALFAKLRKPEIGTVIVGSVVFDNDANVQLTALRMP
jgi:hypothetical protein